MTPRPKAADRRAARTRRALQEALIALMRVKHYDDISIQEIADHADIGRTTFYLHYQSKGDLFLAAHQPLFEATPRADRDGDQRGDDRAGASPWLGTEPSAELAEYFAQMKAQGNPNTLLPEMVSSESSLLLGAIQRRPSRPSRRGCANISTRRAAASTFRRWRRRWPARRSGWWPGGCAARPR
jgi:AcrR family transcriptional regulator